MKFCSAQTRWAFECVYTPDVGWKTGKKVEDVPFLYDDVKKRFGLMTT